MPHVSSLHRQAVSDTGSLSVLRTLLHPRWLDCKILCIFPLWWNMIWMHYRNHGHAFFLCPRNALCSQRQTFEKQPCYSIMLIIGSLLFLLLGWQDGWNLEHSYDFFERKGRKHEILIPKAGRSMRIKSPQAKKHHSSHSNFRRTSILCFQYWHDL